MLHERHNRCGRGGKDGLLKDGCLASPLHGGAELAAAALTVGLHLWRRNPLLSIAAGTALYMTLVA